MLCSQGIRLLELTYPHASVVDFSLPSTKPTRHAPKTESETSGRPLPRSSRLHLTFRLHLCGISQPSNRRLRSILHTNDAAAKCSNFTASCAKCTSCAAHRATGQPRAESYYGGCSGD